jgi:ribosomal protein L28
MPVESNEIYKQAATGNHVIPVTPTGGVTEPFETMFPSCPSFSVVSQPFKRSQLGLFQGRTKQYGNNVPFSKHKTRRTWLPNVQRKRLFSDTLGENVRVKVTTRALKTIKKVRLTRGLCYRIHDNNN